jgi:hypothetical protein
LCGVIVNLRGERRGEERKGEGKKEETEQPKRRVRRWE